MKRFIVSVTCFFFVVATVSCATSPQSIEPDYVSEFQYQNHDCDQLAQEYRRVKARGAELTLKQQGAANRDAVAMGVGLVLFWPALFLLAGSKGNPQELARIRGEVDAIERAAIVKKCLIAETIAEDKVAVEETIKQQESVQEIHKSPVRSY